MKQKGIFEKYYSRVAREGILKAALCGIIVGFFVDFVISLACWFANAAVWSVYLALGIGLLAGAVCAVVAYFKFFRPTTKSIAKRIDSLGLEERLITMTELENDESYIAMRQREDAKAALAKVEPKSIRIQISKTMAILSVVAFVFGSSMTTVSALTSFGFLPNPGEILHPSDGDDDEYLSVTYTVDEGGHFYDADGASVTEIDLEIVQGESAPVIIAVADEGWVFDGWSDGVTTPQRHDTEIEEDLFLLAFFVELEDDDGMGMDGPGMPGNRPGSNRPGDGETNGNRPNQGTTAGAGRYEPSNRVYDGNTPYGDVYDEFYEKAMEELANNKDLTPKQRAMLEAYCESLRAGAMKSENDGNG